eukprot:CAMPEP_0194173072 /NCGR_PEP_ID=MMETSP0154-20130528/7454_1 /TAXON_ID=1049557 /ORGANISM="Thalassiothrix antarctica, Strain L6-D1" /LENGTH=278 /DNA_ID=CAMNT_0038885991 /DNA_START=156 /DNA_END=989 /DNA_ORIENTATION=+
MSLERVGRNRRKGGIDELKPPNMAQQESNWKKLSHYFSTLLPQAKEELKPILRQMFQASINEDYTTASDGIDCANSNELLTKHQLIVMVCNYGQVDLLLNFLCSSYTMDLSRVLIFCTDEKTYRIVMELDILGLQVYYNSVLFQSVSTDAAKAYGDDVFVSVMWAKVVVIHLIQQILLPNDSKQRKRRKYCSNIRNRIYDSDGGIDILFQDVDVIWNKPKFQQAPTNTTSITHPLDLFQDYSDIDIILSEDGARNVRYAPYGGNTGFYYIKHNTRTVW